MAKQITSFSALSTTLVGTRCYDHLWRTVRRVRGGWRYEASDAPGLFADYEMTKYLPLTVIEIAQAEPAPPTPRVPTKVMGRIWWDATHKSPWVSFSGVTSYRFWAADMRRHLPGLRTEMAYTDAVHTAESLLGVAEERAQKAE